MAYDDHLVEMFYNLGVIMTVDAKVMLVVSAIRQSIEQSAGPGVSVNSHANPFFINVNGALDLKHAATLILQRIQQYEEDIKAKIEASIKKAEANAAAEVKSVEAAVEAKVQEAV